MSAHFECGWEPSPLGGTSKQRKAKPGSQVFRARRRSREFPIPPVSAEAKHNKEKPIFLTADIALREVAAREGFEIS